ncbi:MAG TPA: hypothetical protein PLO99_07590, partial [Chitinophagaceae bacterium]|nr:hypothetical protein [Chitinophagaceae bacterium]
VKISTVEWEGGKTGIFYDQEYVLPEELLKNKEQIRIKVEANYKRTAGRVFGVRVVRESR